MNEKILVPLDGSKVGEAALPVVEEIVSKLAPEIKAEVTLFRVISSLAHWVVVGGGGDAMGEVGARVSYTDKELELIKQKAMDYLDKAGEGLRSKGVIVKTKVGTGKAADEIIKAADEINVDFIAMSTHGRSGISRWALGSITERVLRGGSKPLLTVTASKETE